MNKELSQPLPELPEQVRMGNPNGLLPHITHLDKIYAEFEINLISVIRSRANYIENLTDPIFEKRKLTHLKREWRNGDIGFKAIDTMCNIITN